MSALSLLACGGEKDLPRNYDYIRAEPFTELVIELDTVPEYVPGSATKTELENILSPLLDKADGVRVDADQFLASVGSDHVWTWPALLSLAEESYDLNVTSNTIKMHTMFVGGSFVGDTGQSKRLSLRLDDTHLVVFIETIQKACNGGVNAGLPASDRKLLCERSTLGAWLHGAGHLLGLVNDGLPMVGNHEDLNSPGYDTNENCIMHKSFEDSSIIDRFRDRIIDGNLEPISFDAACRADLNAVK